MFETSRGQLLAYAAIAAVLAVVGISSLRGGNEPSAPTGAGATAERIEGGSDAGPEGSGDDGLTISGGGRRLVVDVSGAVARPGVYRLTEGARVIDAIRKAGGPSRGAVVTAINRAARLVDGQQVVLPARTAGAPPGPGSGGGSGSASGTTPGGTGGPVSLGAATVDQLQEIDGIGPVTAEKIIEFRDSKGGLGSIEDLDQVSGIGPVTMESLRSALQP